MSEARSVVVTVDGRVVRPSLVRHMRLLDEPVSGAAAVPVSRLVEQADRLKHALGLQRLMIDAGGDTGPLWSVIDELLDELVESLPTEHRW